MQHTTVIQHQQQPIAIQQQQQQYGIFRRLAVTQTIIGGVAIIIGIVSLTLDVIQFNVAGGIWAGAWILITGLIGLRSSNNMASCGLNGTYMVFNIICSAVTFFNGALFIVGITYYGAQFSEGYRCYDCDSQRRGLGVYIPLCLLMIAEFFISIVAAAFCCKSSSCCCRQPPPTQGVIIAPHQQPYQIVPSGNGQTTVMVPTSYSVSSYPTAGYAQPQYAGYPQQHQMKPGQSYPTQIISQPQTGVMCVRTQNGGVTYVSQGQPMPAQTNIVYSAQHGTAPGPDGNMAAMTNVAPPPYDVVAPEMKNPMK